MYLNPCIFLYSALAVRNNNWLSPTLLILGTINSVALQFHFKIFRIRNDFGQFYDKVEVACLTLGIIILTF